MLVASSSASVDPELIEAGDKLEDSRLSEVLKLKVFVVLWSGITPPVRF